MKLFFSIPMIITFTRIIASIFLLFPLSIYYGINNITGIIYFFLALTDFLDGYFARKLNNISYLGSILDPLSDKILFISSAIPFIVYGIIPTLIIYGLIIRDLIVMTLRECSQKHNIQLLPSKSAKLKTANLFYLTILTYFIQKHFIITILWILILITSWITLFEYLKFIYSRIKFDA